METEKDKWLNKIIASGQERQQLRPPEHLYGNILNAINNPESKTAGIDFKQLRVGIIAASILIAVNVGVLFYTAVEKRTQSAYTLDSNNLALY
jgi:hypothetical protein